MTSDSSVEFLRSISSLKYPISKQALALIWFETQSSPCQPVGLDYICKTIEAATGKKPHITQLRKSLRNNRDASYRASKDAFSITFTKHQEIDIALSDFIAEKPLPKSNDVVPHALFSARGYLQKVADQINASYKYGLYDCCAGMCRRLFETLIIEAYEAAGDTSSITKPDKHYKMLEGLISAVEQDYSSKNPTVKVGRNTLKCLKDIKALGDKSVHNPRFNARKSDIEPLIAEIRSATEDLLHRANLHPDGIS